MADLFDEEVLDSISEMFDLDCFVLIVDDKQRNTNQFFKNQHKTIQIVSKTNISSVFISLEKRSYCGYFILIDNPDSAKKTIKEISERSENNFQEFSWFIKLKQVSPDLGLKLQLNTDIKLLQFGSGKCDVYELYGLGGEAVLTKIGYLDEDGQLEISGVDKLQRIKNLQGVTLR